MSSPKYEIMKQKERDEKNFTNRVRTVLSDYVFRTFISSTLSFFVTIAFAGYNIFLGVSYQSAWNIGIAIYYALLVCIRACILFSEKRFHKKYLTDEQKEPARKNLFLMQSIFLFIIDLALIAPISLMVMQEKEIHFTAIPAIATAAYTTYKIILSTRSIIKTRKQKNLSVRILKNISFVDALVSVLSLQYTLIMTFGNGIEGEMLTLCATTSFAIWTLLIVVSLLSLFKAIKLKQS